MNASTSKGNVVTQILFSVVCGGLGYLLLFGKNIQIATLCQIMCGGLVAVGVVSIVSYFMSGDFKRIDRYGFAIGVLLILLGCIGLLQNASVTANFELYIGGLSLLLGVLTLQSTVQVKVLDYGIWILNLILSIICLTGSFFVLSRITAVTSLINGFSSWLLLICGVSCLISMIVTWICIVLAPKREKKRKEREEAAAQTAVTAAPADQAVPAGQPAFAPSEAFEPAETIHAGAGFESASFNASADAPASSAFPASEGPELVFEPSGNHTEFQPAQAPEAPVEPDVQKEN